MRERRFKIAGWLFLIVAFEVGLAALRESSDLWDNALFATVLGILLVSVSLAVHRHGTTQAFWLGFALFGWAYLALSVAPSTTSRLITTKALDYLDSKVQERRLRPYTSLVIGIRSVNPALAMTANQPAGTANARPSEPDSAAGAFFRGSSGTTENFVRIGHSLAALVAGWLGGRFACGRYRRSGDSEASTASPVEYARTSG
jgi:hypothetical protein